MKRMLIAVLIATVTGSGITDASTSPGSRGSGSASPLRIRHKMALCDGLCLGPCEVTLQDDQKVSGYSLAIDGKPMSIVVTGRVEAEILSCPILVEARCDIFAVNVITESELMTALESVVRDIAPGIMHELKLDMELTDANVVPHIMKELIVDTYPGDEDRGCVALMKLVKTMICKVLATFRPHITIKPYIDPDCVTRYPEAYYDYSGRCLMPRRYVHPVTKELCYQETYLAWDGTRLLCSGQGAKELGVKFL